MHDGGRAGHDFRGLVEWPEKLYKTMSYESNESQFADRLGVEGGGRVGLPV